MGGMGVGEVGGGGCLATGCCVSWPAGSNFDADTKGFVIVHR